MALVLLGKALKNRLGRNLVIQEPRDTYACVLPCATEPQPEGV